MQERIELTPGLAGRLEELRVDAGLSRPEFAKMAGVAEATIWRMENEQSSPSVAQLESMQAAGIDVIYLVTGRRSTSLAPITDDERWGRCCIAVNEALARHGLAPSPATYWRLVRLLYSEAVNEAQLRKNMAAALEKAGSLATQER